MATERLKIAAVARTIGLEYDDRIRKECITLSKIADVKIFAVFYNNNEEEGVTSYGVPYKAFRLVTREKLGSGKLLIVKALEFYWRVKKYLKEYDLVWAHEEYAYLFALLGGKNKFIWDLHEIPSRINNFFFRKAFHYIEKKSQKIIHANDYRIEYLKETGIVKQDTKNAVIRNYPDHNFLASHQVPHNFIEFERWLGGEKYVYLQGLNNSDRYPYNSIASIIEYTTLKTIVAGPFYDNLALSKLNNNYDNELKTRVFFAGMVCQLAIPAFLKNAVFSVILYNMSKPNNRFCEANRLYQAVNFGIPVIVGSNEPMAEIVNKHKMGIVLNGDGHDLKELHHAITKLLKDLAYYKKNAELYGVEYIWQDDLIDKNWFCNK